MGENKGFFSRLAAGLSKTRNSIVSGIDSIFSGFSAINDDFYEELEEILIMSDVGINATTKIIDNLKEKVKETKTKDPSECRKLLMDSMKEQMSVPENAYEFENRKSVVLLIGVNGVGKTTSVGKLAGQLKAQGKKVLVAAADTFRAAAIEQLTEWAHRAEVDIIAQKEGSDPAAVVFDAVTAAKARNTDVLLCDTAGIRRTDDKVENIGIERSIKEIDGAGLILAVFDGSKAPEDDDRELVQKIIDSKTASVALINKTDMLSNGINGALADLLSCFEHKVEISALTGEGFDVLANTVDSMFIDGTLDFDNDAIITGARQYAAISKAAELLSNAVYDIERGVSLDACCVEVECAMSALGELDGREIGEEIVHEIFSHFCVGK